MGPVAGAETAVAVVGVLRPTAPYRNCCVVCDSFTEEVDAGARPSLQSCDPFCISTGVHSFPGRSLAMSRRVLTPWRSWATAPGSTAAPGRVWYRRSGVAVREPQPPGSWPDALGDASLHALALPSSRCSTIVDATVRPRARTLTSHHCREAARFYNTSTDWLLSAAGRPHIRGAYRKKYPTLPAPGGTILRGPDYRHRTRVLPAAVLCPRPPCRPVIGLVAGRVASQVGQRKFNGDAPKDLWWAE